MKREEKLCKSPDKAEQRLKENVLKQRSKAKSFNDRNYKCNKKLSKKYWKSIDLDFSQTLFETFWEGTSLKMFLQKMQFMSRCKIYSSFFKRW